MVTARLTNYRQSPRKVRLVANFVRGKKVTEALSQLHFVPKKAADPIRKLIESAVASAENNKGLKIEDLYVKEIRIDKGVTMYRQMPRAHGRAFPIRKRCSHLIVSLGEKGASTKKVDSTKAVEATAKPKKKAVAAKKTVAKKAPAKKAVKKDNK